MREYFRMHFSCNSWPLLIRARKASRSSILTTLAGSRAEDVAVGEDADGDALAVRLFGHDQVAHMTLAHQQRRYLHARVTLAMAGLRGQIRVSPLRWRQSVRATPTHRGGFEAHQ
nr:hypothetical protein [Janthinobacterium sp. UMAB-56]